MSHKKQVLVFFLEAPKAIKNKTLNKTSSLILNTPLNSHNPTHETSKKKVIGFFGEFAMVSYNNGTNSVKNFGEKIQN